MRSPASIVLAVTSLLVGVAHADDDDDDDTYEGDGPEADTVALFKLDDLIEVAVRRAPDLARAKADRTIAKAKAGAARADQQWIMTMGANYKGEAVGGQVEVAPFEVVRTDAVTGQVGLGRNLPTGGNLAVEVGLGHVKRELNIPAWVFDAAGMDPATGTAGAQAPVDNNTISEFYTRIQSTARVTLKQPLARGFGPSIALAGERRADLELATETLEAQLAAEQLVRDIVTGYWDLAYAAYEVDTRAESLALAQAQEKLTREELRAGKSPQNAVNAVIYEIAVREEAHLRAQIDSERKSLELRRKVGLGIGRREVVMRPGEAFEIGDAEWDIDDVLARSRKENRKLATIALQKKVADVDVSVARNATLPQVDLNVSGALLGGGSTTGESFQAISEVGGYEVMAGLTVSFELSGAAKSAHTAALARRRRLDIDRADLERQLDAEVVTSVKAVTSARTRVMLSDRAIAVAESNVRAERLSFTAGKTNNYSVMQRQSELIEARLRRGRAVSDYHTAVAQLQFLGGTLLAQYRVNVRPKARRR